jgi:hypothetical protein
MGVKFAKPQIDLKELLKRKDGDKEIGGGLDALRAHGVERLQARPFEDSRHIAIVGGLCRA